MTSIYNNVSALKILLFIHWNHYHHKSNAPQHYYITTMLSHVSYFFTFKAF